MLPGHPFLPPCCRRWSLLVGEWARSKLLWYTPCRWRSSRWWARAALAWSTRQVLADAHRQRGSLGACNERVHGGQASGCASSTACQPGCIYRWMKNPLSDVPFSFSLQGKWRSMTVAIKVGTCGGCLSCRARALGLVRALHQPPSRTHLCVVVAPSPLQPFLPLACAGHDVPGRRLCKPRAAACNYRWGKLQVAPCMCTCGAGV